MASPTNLEEYAGVCTGEIIGSNPGVWYEYYELPFL